MKVDIWTKTAVLGVLVSSAACRSNEGFHSLETLRSASLCASPSETDRCVTIRRGLRATIKDVRYTKEHRYYLVKLADGREGYIQHGPEVRVMR